LLTYDALEMSFREFPFERRPDCAVCGEHPAITTLRDQDELCGASPERLRRLAPAALRAALTGTADEPGRIALIDVREPQEFAVGCLEGSINIPVGELPGRIAEIPRETTPVFICRSGRRSLGACALALRSGIGAVAHLEGGLLAWTREVDPAFVLDPPAEPA
ncbi:MAG: rhodanese-like domain-containing protein, partial [Steroidobacteraceae bacterium]